MHLVVKNVLVRFFTYVDKLIDDAEKVSAKDTVLSKYVQNFKKICIGFCLSGAVVILFSSIGPAGTVAGIVLCIAGPVVFLVHVKRLKRKVMGDGDIK